MSNMTGIPGCEVILRLSISNPEMLLTVMTISPETDEGSIILICPSDGLGHISSPDSGGSDNRSLLSPAVHLQSGVCSSQK